MKTMKTIKTIKPVTLVLALLCVLFAGLIGFSYYTKRAAAPKPPAPAGGAPQSAGGRTPQAGGASQSSGGRTPQAGNAPQGSGGRTPQAGGAPQSGGGGRGGPRGIAVRTAPLERGSIENTVIVNGDVLARSQVAVYPNVAGKIAEARFSVGETVRQGEVLAMIDPSRPGDVYAKSPVIAPVAGTVLSAPIHRGETVSSQSAVYVLGDLSGLLVETFVPERFSAAAQKGVPGTAGFSGIPGESFPMTVDEVSPVIDPASRTVRVRLVFTAPDPRIKAGMFATVTLVTARKDDVLVVPRSAVIHTYGDWVVFVAKGDVAEKREIVIGLESEASMEVAGGVAEGEMIIVAGQNFLSHGDPIRPSPTAPQPPAAP